MTALAIPTLETARLRLRPLRQADLDPLAAFYASPRAAFYGGPLTRSQAWRQMSAFAGCWVIRGYGPWMVDLRETGETVGLCGPWFPVLFPEPEITWALFDGHTGRGYATEAARAALAHAYGPLGWDTAVSCIDPENRASVRLAERLGARADYDHPLEDGTVLRVFRHPAPAREESAA